MLASFHNNPSYSSRVCCPGKVISIHLENAPTLSGNIRVLPCVFLVLFNAADWARNGSVFGELSGRVALRAASLVRRVRAE
jgi:hypothetical protein